MTYGASIRERYIGHWLWVQNLKGTKILVLKINDTLIFFKKLKSI